MPPEIPKRSNWGMRWLALAFGVGLFLMIGSIGYGHGHKSVLIMIFQISLAFGCLAAGIYEFAKRDRPKGDA